MKFLRSIFGASTDLDNDNNNGSNRLTIAKIKSSNLQAEFSQFLNDNYQRHMPSGYRIRRLKIDDYEKGYIKLLSQLTSTGNITRQKFEGRYNLIADSSEYFIVVIEDENTRKIVGSGTLVLEYKFIHDCAMRGRIEDIVVDADCRGKSFGKLINLCLVELARDNFNVYKLSLECKDSLITFYEQFGYKVDIGNNFLVQRLP